MALSMVAALFVAPGLPAHADDTPTDASVLSSTQSNPTIVGGGSNSDDTDTIDINYQSQIGDVLKVALPTGFVGGDNFGSISDPSFTASVGGTPRTLTLTFKSATSLKFSVVLSPKIDSYEYDGLVSRLNNSAWMQLGTYTLGVEATRAANGSKYDANATFTTDVDPYGTGTAWRVAFVDAPSTYSSGMEYSFKAPDIYDVAGADNSAWYRVRSWVTLNMPADFELNAAGSPGWSQPDGVGGTIYYDPTVSGAGTTFKGKFTAANGQTYTAANTSSISGYFDYNGDKTTVPSDKPVSVTLAAPVAGAMLSKEENSVTVATESNRLRPGTAITYTQSPELTNPAGHQTITNANQTISPADGSVQLGAKVTQSNPVEGQTITVVADSADGTSKTYTYTITAADVTAGTATYSIPDTTEDNPYTKISVTYSEMDAGSTGTVALSDQSLATYTGGKDIEDGDSRKATETVSGTTASGDISYSGDLTVTYLNNLKVSDWTMRTTGNPWRSNSGEGHNITFAYGNTDQHASRPERGGVLPAGDSTHVIYEPVIYVMIPAGVNYAGYTVDSSLDDPANVTTYKASNGQTVVKFDWTGTKAYIPTDVDGAVQALWTIPKFGVPITSTSAIWVSTVNDPDLSWNPYNEKAPFATIPADVTTSATGGDTAAVLTATQNLQLTAVQSLSGFSTIVSNQGLEGTAAANALSKTADHTLKATVVSNQPSAAGQELSSLTNLPTDCLSLELTGAGSITDINGAAVSSGNAYLLYSSATQATPAKASDISTDGYVKADNISSIGGWSAVKSFIMVVPSLEEGVEYTANIPVTDTKAADELNRQCAISTTAASGDLAPFNSTVTDMYYLLAGKKIWDDANNQDGKRPDSVTVDLLDGSKKVVDTQTTDASKGWKYTFSDDVPALNASGKIINYTVKEESPAEGYTDTYSNKSYADGGDLNVTNSYTPATTTVSGTKTWADSSDQDGKRPDSITVKLFADGKDTGKTAIVTAADAESSDADKWDYSFTGLAKYENTGTEVKEVTYTVAEEQSADLTSAKYTSEVKGFDITNSYAPETTTVSGTKTWADNGDQDGVRPKSVTVKLLADGKDTGKTAIVTAADAESSDANKWDYSFTGLAKYENHGTPIEYTVEEEQSDELTSAKYTSEVKGFDITNTHTTAKEDISGTKTWADASNQDGVRPDSVTLNLLADGQKVDSKTLTVADADPSNANVWKYTFAGKDKYENKGTEVTYTVEEEQSDELKTAGYTVSYQGLDVTNTHVPAQVELTGSKTWDDASNQDGIRPTSITVNLLADGVKVDSRVVTENTDGNWEYSFGKLDEYKAGAVKQKIVYTVEEEAVDGYQPTATGLNLTNTHVPAVVTETGTKTWNDNHDQDGKRPESITVDLYANGAKVDGKEATVTPDADGNWTYSFANLPQKKAGKDIVYTAEEAAVTNGYTAKTDGMNITNSYTPETTTVSGTKTWVDNGDQDGVRPKSVTVKLLADGKDTGKTAIVTAADAESSDANVWDYSFTGLAKYENHGTPIEYTVEEEQSAELTSADYVSEVKGFDITNSYTPETATISGTKTWADADDQDGLRPDSIDVELKADGEVVKTAAVTADTDGAWKYSFADMPVYKNGTKIAYTVSEASTPAGYTAAADGYNLTNTHEPSMLNLAGAKSWADGDNQDGVRPDSITVDLLANGMKVDTVSTGASKDWKYEFSNKPEFAAGEKITYSVEEEAVAGYEATTDGLNLTNTHVAATTTIAGTKSWADGDNQDGIRPDSVTISLLADGEVVKSANATAKNGWKYSFKDVPVYKAGKAIAYTVKETDIAKGYTAKIDAATHDIVNTHVPATVAVNGTKIWNDVDNHDAIRPDSVTVDLLADGKVVKSADVSAKSGWKYSFTDLPEFAAGKKIAYTVKEDSVAKGYTASVKGYDITNTHVPTFVSRITPPAKTPSTPATPESTTTVTTLPITSQPTTPSETPVPVATAKHATAVLAKTGAGVEAIVAVLLLSALAGVSLMGVRKRSNQE
ncbi:MAG: Cna B-type domain-containing protein [Bifidobacteriaceae bacterium]|jgi:hypothetical protein|nr:Cna B-type domain-containing protein [Bifidobacteriaceae bacterium]